MGQDLSTTDDGKTHAAGNLYGDEVEGYLANPEFLPGNYQDKVKTNWVLKMFHQTYEYMSLIAERINATRAALKLLAQRYKP